MGRPFSSVSREFFVGAVGNGWMGIVWLDRICCPATPNLAKHCCLKACEKLAQLSDGRCRIMSDEGWVAEMESIVN
jgi:hypothetical protein